MVHDITRRDVLDVLDRVVDGGAPIAANRTLSAMRKLFNWCVPRDIIAVSPCAGVKPPTPERSRDRVLSDDELRLVWRAADKIAWPFGLLVKLLALTGQRRDEVAKMRWDELDLEAGLWTLPRERVKTDQPHEVPLSAASVNVLKSVPRIAGSSFVFTTNGTAPSSGYSKGKRKLDALLPSDMPDWRLHDLRRTVASGMARLGIHLPVIEKVLNHASGSFAGIVEYINAIASPKRSARHSTLGVITLNSSSAVSWRAFCRCTDGGNDRGQVHHSCFSRAGVARRCLFSFSGDRKPIG